MTITTPPFFGSIWRMLSGTFRSTSFTARAEECEKITGASERRIACAITESETWERSTSTPSRFISRTTSRPNGVRPLCRSESLAASTHASVVLWVSVMYRTPSSAKARSTGSEFSIA